MCACNFKASYLDMLRDFQGCHKDLRGQINNCFLASGLFLSQAFSERPAGESRPPDMVLLQVDLGSSDMIACQTRSVESYLRVQTVPWLGCLCVDCG